MNNYIFENSKKPDFEEDFLKTFNQSNPEQNQAVVNFQPTKLYNVLEGDESGLYNYSDKKFE